MTVGVGSETYKHHFQWALVKMVNFFFGQPRTVCWFVELIRAWQSDIRFQCSVNKSVTKVRGSRTNIVTTNNDDAGDDNDYTRGKFAHVKRLTQQLSDKSKQPTSSRFYLFYFHVSFSQSALSRTLALLSSFRLSRRSVDSTLVKNCCSFTRSFSVSPFACLPEFYLPERATESRERTANTVRAEKSSAIVGTRIAYYEGMRENDITRYGLDCVIKKVDDSLVCQQLALLPPLPSFRPLLFNTSTKVVTCSLYFVSVTTTIRDSTLPPFQSDEFLQTRIIII